VAKATSMALGGGSATSRAKKKKIKNFRILPLGVAEPPPSRSRVADWLNQGRQQPPMGWPATPLLFYLILLFLLFDFNIFYFYLCFLFKN
jgi:hypothetical protein